MNPKELLFAHRYSEAAEAFHGHMLQHPEQNYYQGLGQALLCLKNYSESLFAFKKSNEIDSQRLKNSLPCLNWIATAMWLGGEREQAQLEWRRAVSGILDGSIQYGDAAGGAVQGLLLLYSTVTLKNKGQYQYAMEYLQRIKRRKVYGSVVLWPRPIVMMILGDCSFEQTLEIGAGSRDLDICLKNAGTDLLKRRQLCQTLFHAAIRERESGNEIACIKMMQTCCELENPIIEMEWYLAQNECIVH